MVYPQDESERNERRQRWVALAFFVLSLLLLNLPGGAQLQLATALRATVLRPFVSMQRTVTRARLRSAETELLRTQVDSLTGVLANTRTLAEENTQLRDLLDLGERMGSGFLPANAVRSGTAGSESVFLLDVGRLDGVRVNAPVLVPEGLAGKVVETRNRESIAMDWSHPDFRASAMTLDGEVYGLVEPDRGVFREADRLLLNGIPFYAALEPGTVVVTSGRGGVFPRGIVIGTVLELNEAGERWRRSYWLQPATRPGAALHVLVGLPRTDLDDLDLSGIFVPRSVTDSLAQVVDSLAAVVDSGPVGPPPPPRDSAGGPGSGSRR